MSKLDPEEKEEKPNLDNSSSASIVVQMTGSVYSFDGSEVDPWIEVYNRKLKEEASKPWKKEDHYSRGDEDWDGELWDEEDWEDKIGEPVQWCVSKTEDQDKLPEGSTQWCYPNLVCRDPERAPHWWNHQEDDGPDGEPDQSAANKPPGS